MRTTAPNAPTHCSYANAYYSDFFNYTRTWVILGSERGHARHARRAAHLLPRAPILQSRRRGKDGLIMSRPVDQVGSTPIFWEFR